MRFWPKIMPIHAFRTVINRPSKDRLKVTWIAGMGNYNLVLLTDNKGKDYSRKPGE